MRPLIENLERRQYQSSDVAVAAVVTDLPPAILAAPVGKTKGSSASVTLASVGDAIVKSDKSPIHVTVGLYDGETLVATLGTATVKASAMGKKPVKVKLARPSSLPEGTFNVEARVDASSLGDANPANDRAVAQPVTVTSASADLSLTASTGLFGFVPGGSVAFLSYSFKNVGSVAAKGNATVVLYAKFEDGSETQLGIADVNFKLNPGATLTAKRPLTFNVPASKAVDLPVSLEARLTTNLSLPDPFANNVAAAGDFVIPANSHTTGGGGGDPNATHTPAMFAEAGIDPTIAFTDTYYESALGMTIELGDYLDAEGGEGTYTFGLPDRKFTISTSDDEPGVAGTLSTKVKLGGRAITFGVPKKGSDGSATLVDGEKVYIKFIA